ncbi:MAG: flavodoxin-dependent (E)-4-hydroxy-3-methylbut-2-enyl-diphosphate synthase [Bryobacterales bacterium]
MRVTRRNTIACDVGGVTVGGGAPVVVQSMTNTDTADTAATVNQVMALAKAGSELVRVTVNNEAAAQAVPVIVDTLSRASASRSPSSGTSTTTGTCCSRSIPTAPALWRSTDQPRQRQHRQEAATTNFRTMIECAIEYGKPVRIGVNWGSLDQQLLTKLMDENAASPNPKDAEEVMHGRSCSRRSTPPTPPSVTVCPPTESSSRPRSRTCRTWSPSTRT